MSNDLERRLAEALEARAEQVRPEDLDRRGLPGPSGAGRRPRTLVWTGLAAAACLAAVGAGVVVPRLLADPDAAPPASRFDVPPDVGRDWEPVRVGSGSVDLDGDGEPDRFRFRGEDTEDFDGRVRLDVTLSGGGSAYGVVGLGTTLYSYAPQGADVDGDGADELVLTVDGPDAMSTYPAVLDLRDGVLVEVPTAATEEDLTLRSGGVPYETQGLTVTPLESVADWWVEDSELRSSLSREPYPTTGMDWWVPDPYVARSWTWRVDDGVLVPEEVADVCTSRPGEERRPCEPGEQDGLPDLTPVATDLVEAGESADLVGGLPARVRVVPAARMNRVLLGPVGEPAAGIQMIGKRLRVFTTAPSAVVVDEVSAAYDEDGDDRPDGVLVATADGPITLLRAPDADPAWLTEAGEVYTTSGESGRVELGQWARDGDDLIVVPLGTVCLPDDGDVTEAERC